MEKEMVVSWPAVMVATPLEMSGPEKPVMAGETWGERREGEGEGREGEGEGRERKREGGERGGVDKDSVNH